MINKHFSFSCIIYTIFYAGQNNQEHLKAVTFTIRLIYRVLQKYSGLKHAILEGFEISARARQYICINSSIDEKLFY